MGVLDGAVEEDFPVVGEEGLKKREDVVQGFGLLALLQVRNFGAGGLVDLLAEAFVDGMAIFTQAKGGLMYEAAVGGQKLKVELK